MSVTTNGQLLTETLLREYVSAGLDEVTLSVHGTSPETYEWLMAGARFERFKAAIDAVRHVKAYCPGLRLRINYTVNADNVDELAQLVDVVGPDVMDVLQIRPVQRLGNTGYDNFDMAHVKDTYDAVMGLLLERCRREGIECLAPSKADLDIVAARVDERERLFESVTYCYVGPSAVYAADYDVERDTYRSYHRRKRTFRRLLWEAFRPGCAAAADNDTTKKLNYR